MDDSVDDVIFLFSIASGATSACTNDSIIVKKGIRLNFRKKIPQRYELTNYFIIILVREMNKH
jgi:hypothetical protein